MNNSKIKHIQQKISLVGVTIGMGAVSAITTANIYALGTDQIAKPLTRFEEALKVLGRMMSLAIPIAVGAGISILLF